MTAGYQLDLGPDVLRRHPPESNLQRFMALVASWGACEPALEWLAKWDGDVTLQTLWDACPRHTWCVWLVSREQADRGASAYTGRAPDLSRYGVR